MGVNRSKLEYREKMGVNESKLELIGVGINGSKSD
jgi:hypothetical protein